MNFIRFVGFVSTLSSSDARNAHPPFALSCFAIVKNNKEPRSRKSRAPRRLSYWQDTALRFCTLIIAAKQS
jgi:hypothetical protein